MITVDVTCISMCVFQSTPADMGGDQNVAPAVSDTLGGGGHDNEMFSAGAGSTYPLLECIMFSSVLVDEIQKTLRSLPSCSCLACVQDCTRIMQGLARHTGEVTMYMYWNYFWISSASPVVLQVALCCPMCKLCLKAGHIFRLSSHPACLLARLLRQVFFFNVSSGFVSVHVYSSYSQLDLWLCRCLCCLVEWLLIRSSMFRNCFPYIA